MEIVASNTNCAMATLLRNPWTGKWVVDFSRFKKHVQTASFDAYDDAKAWARRMVWSR